MAYTTLTSLKRQLGIATWETGDDDLLTALIARAQAAIDDHCRRWFEARTATRYYRNDPRIRRGQVLLLDADLLTLTSLINGDGQTIPLDQVWLEPRNEPPYGSLRLKTSYIWNYNTDGEVQVTGTWGYSATAPGDVVQATERWAAYMYRQKDSSVFDVTADPSAGIITTPQGIPKDVKILLAPFVRSMIR